MILMHIGFGLMTVATVVALIGNHRLIKSLRKASDSLKEANEKLKEAHKLELEYLGSIHNQVTVRENSGKFSIFRESENFRFLVACYYYDPNDPNDREYIRIHAEEVAEKLNEKP